MKNLAKACRIRLSGLDPAILAPLEADFLHVASLEADCWGTGPEEKARFEAARLALLKKLRPLRPLRKKDTRDRSGRKRKPDTRDRSGRTRTPLTPEQRDRKNRRAREKRAS